MAEKLKLNRRAFRELRNSPGVVDHLERLADDVADTAGRGLPAEDGQQPFGVDRASTRTRARFQVFPATGKALGRNRKHNSLVRALGSLRR